MGTVIVPLLAISAGLAGHIGQSLGRFLPPSPKAKTGETLRTSDIAGWEIPKKILRKSLEDDQMEVKHGEKNQGENHRYFRNRSIAMVDHILYTSLLWKVHQKKGVETVGIERATLL